MELLPRPEKHSNNLLKQKQEHFFDVPPQLRVVEEFNVTTSKRRNSFNEERQEKLRDRVAIFIDGTNLFYAAMYLDLEIDYAKLLCCLTKRRRLLRAYFYTPIDITNKKQQNFLLWMRRNGYRVIAKELVQFSDGSKKANLDVEMTVDMLNIAKSCTSIVLLSGNGELSYAVNAIANLGVEVELVALRSMLSESMINVADRYTDLEDIKEDIRKSS